MPNGNGVADRDFLEFRICAQDGIATSAIIEFGQRNRADAVASQMGRAMENSRMQSCVIACVQQVGGRSPAEREWSECIIDISDRDVE